MQRKGRRRRTLLLLSVLLALAGPVRAGDDADPPPEEVEAPTWPVPVRTIAAPLPPDLLEPGSDPVQVMLRIAIDEAGQVVEVQVATSSGVDAIDEAAQRAAEAMSFLPATWQGEPVPVTIEYPVAFLAPPAPPPELTPARLSGRVRQLGTKAPLVDAEVAIWAARRVEVQPAPEDAGVDEIAPEPVESLDGIELADAPHVVVFSEPDGRFDLGELPPGLWVVTCAHPGSQLARFVEELAEGAKREVLYRLLPVAANETVITARVPNDAPERVLTREEMTVLPGASRDPMAALKSLPGVSQANRAVRQFGTSEQSHTPVLRGSAPEDSITMLDGLPAPFAYHMIDRFSVVGDDLIGAALLAPAAPSARYGDLTGGVVGLTLRSPRSDRIGGFFDPGIGRASFAVEGPITAKTRFYVAIRRTYFELFLRGFMPKDTGIDFATVPYFQDQQLLLETDLAKWLTVTVGYLGSLDGMEMLRSNAPRDAAPLFDMDMDMHRIFVRADFETASGFRNRLHPAVTFWSWRYQVGDDHHYEDRHTTLHVGDDLHLPLLPWLSLEAGALLEVDWLIQRRDTATLTREDTGPIASYGGGANLTGEQRATRTWLGGWLGLPIQPIEQLTLVPEVRVDWFAAIGEVKVQPRARIGIQPIPRLRISLAGGRYAQSPSYDELNETTGNPELAAEGAWHANVGLLWTPIDVLSIDLQGYYKALDHQAVSSWELLDFDEYAEAVQAGTVDDEDPTHGLSNDGVGRIYGGELFARFDVGRTVRVAGWLGYGLSWAQRRDFPDEEWRWFSMDRRHQLTAVVNVTLPDDWTIGARFILQSGNPDTAVEGSVFFANSHTWVPRYGPLYGERNEPYHQLDLRFGHRIWNKRELIDIYLEVLNVYASRSGGWRFYSFDWLESETLYATPYVNFAARIEF